MTDGRGDGDDGDDSRDGRMVDGEGGVVIRLSRHQ